MNKIRQWFEWNNNYRIQEKSEIKFKKIDCWNLAYGQVKLLCLYCLPCTGVAFAARYYFIFVLYKLILMKLCIIVGEMSSLYTFPPKTPGWRININMYIKWCFLHPFYLLSILNKSEMGYFIGEDSKKGNILSWYLLLLKWKMWSNLFYEGYSVIARLYITTSFFWVHQEEKATRKINWKTNRVSVFIREQIHLHRG